jgi:DNA-binding response OmpR family regulator
MEMKHQVIVADDSQTIQKVIAITLSSEPYELTECLDVKNLETLVSQKKPKLVLLDFNLSDDKTGYDLCKDIKNANPDTQVLYLFGTFDTIDEELISESGASNWIVKPFDGNKFINLCRALTQGDISAVEEIAEDADDSNEEWVMDVPAQIEGEEVIEEATPNEIENKNALESSMEDWGIEVPGIIGQSDNSSLEIPEVINSVNTQEADQELTPSDEMLYPESEDLEYPEIIEPDQKPNVELTSIDELSVSESEELEASEDELFDSDSSQTDIESLKEQIEDEQDDLWTLDEDNNETEEEEKENEVLVLRETPSDFPQDVMIEDVEKRNDIADFKETIDQTPKSEQVAPTSVASPIDMDELLEKIRPMIEDIVRDECKKITEKVSWEVIPDLAENLIKAEIKNISKQVLDQ